MTAAGRVLFYVQHLLGTGHVRRAVRIADAMVERGLDVRLVSGGVPVTAFGHGRAQLVQLPGVRALDQNFSALVDARGRPIDDAFRAARREALLDCYASFRPDALILETFPFGRRQMRFELLPLLEAAREDSGPDGRPLVFASVRDVLHARHKPGRAEETLRLLVEFFDGVLVHADPSFIRLEESFPQAGQLGDAITYTGYVSEPPPPEAGTEAGDAVVVSVGGGAVGMALLRATLAAMPRSLLAERRWRLLTGTALPQADFDELRATAPPGMVVERNRGDFLALIARCSVTVSQGGYNTVMEVIRAGTPAVIVPFEGQGETEQLYRARRLEAAGVATVVREVDLDAGALANAIDITYARGRLAAPAIDLDGAAASARTVAERIAACRDRTQASADDA